MGYHPGLFPAYILPKEEGEPPDPRHNREYMAGEVVRLLEDSGFEVALIETAPFRAQPEPELAWVSRLLERFQLPRDLRGQGIFAVGRKTGPVKKRYPSWLYE